tara:strand:+ start:8371 stop:9288 length:918 start_codon:yes stop_codon:yes gene_type:complete
MSKVLITLVGPTAVGKTALAIKLAKYYGSEIVSADSRQFYKELNIGTAKPSIHELSLVKHHLIGNISVSEEYNISDFEKDATNSINKAFKKNNHVILVGGSGLYINTVLYGLDKIPKVDISVRKKLNKEFDNNGIEKLVKKLKKLDPKIVKSIDLNNHRRIIRALEVCISTNKPYSSFLKTSIKKPKYNSIIIGLNLNRENLHSRINKRVDQMIDNGLVNEVKSLKIYEFYNSLNTIGYTEIFNYLNEKSTLENAIEKIKTNSRRYAKRQITWFKSNQNIKWFTDEYNFNEIIDVIDKFSTQQLV